MPEHKISWKDLKIFIQEDSNDDHWLTLSFLDNVNFAFWAFIWEQFVNFVEDFGAQVSKYSYIKLCEHKNIFALEV